jgi:hypothetical protein
MGGVRTVIMAGETADFGESKQKAIYPLARIKKESQRTYLI